MVFKNPGYRERFCMCLVLLAASAALIAGWRLFWFLTDDAFISFRYISNAHLGYGYVWNPPPFRPVEGYTNFLWVVLLDVIWRIANVMPPDSANYVSLFFSWATLLVLARMCYEIPWRQQIKRWRVLFVAWALAFVLLNRTFLAWTSSGLETAMFTFFVVGWVYLSTRLPAGSVWTQAAYGLCAALAALTRPDGLLLVAGSGLVLLHQYAVRWKTDGLRRSLSWALSSVPLALVPAHIVWRRHFYGEWLPNTYYAKLVAPWPEAGLRYTASFIVEYGLWFLIAIALAILAGWALRPNLRPRRHGPLLVAFAVMAAHLAYYALLAGGDHFEYRVYNHLVVLLPFLTLLLLNGSGVSARNTIALVMMFLAVSLPVPWTHWALTHNVDTFTSRLYVPIESAWPKPLRWYARQFDTLQGWLLHRFVAVRHQEHKLFLIQRSHLFPPREQGEKIDGKDFPVLALNCVGIGGWVLPHVVIIDKLGLNDYVAARTPVDVLQGRIMAHDRQAPTWYISAFRPTMTLSGKSIRATPRRKPLTEDMIRLIETRSWEWAKRQHLLHAAWPPADPPSFACAPNAPQPAPQWRPRQSSAL